MENPRREKRALMSAEKVKAFVDAHGHFVHMPLGLPNPWQSECIDDRQNAKEGERDSFAYPGGTFGVLITVLAAVNKLGNKVTFQEVVSFCEREFNGMTFHTDEHNGHQILSVSGCGHSKAALENPAYGLSASMRTRLRAYAEDLSRREDRVRIKSFSYSGDHGAMAVFRINDDVGSGKYLTFPHRVDQAGVQAFVVNDTLNVAVLKQLASRLQATFGGALGASQSELANLLVDTYARQLSLTANKLARDDEGRPLPCFAIRVKGSKVSVVQE